MKSRLAGTTPHPPGQMGRGSLVGVYDQLTNFTVFQPTIFQPTAQRHKKRPTQNFLEEF
jgi:hypothetical protein